MTAGGLLIATTAIWVFSYPVGVWILGDAASGPRSRRSGRAGSRLAANGASIAIAEGGRGAGKSCQRGEAGPSGQHPGGDAIEQAIARHGEGYTP
jgi:hypothetical protein